MSYKRKTADIIEIRFETSDGEKFFIEKDVSHHKNVGMVVARIFAKRLVKSVNESRGTEVELLPKTVTFEITRVPTYLL